MNNSFVCVVFVIVIGAAFSSSISLSAESVDTDSITLAIDFSEPCLESIDKSVSIVTRVTLTNLENTRDSGKPSLPVRTVKLLLP